MAGAIRMIFGRAHVGVSLCDFSGVLCGGDREMGPAEDFCLVSVFPESGPSVTSGGCGRENCCCATFSGCGHD